MMVCSKILLTFLTLFSTLNAQSVCPEILGRDFWGARPPAGTPDVMKHPAPYFVIHHTVMGNCTTTENCIKDMKEIQDFHIDDRGWLDIGYNFLIGGDGLVYEGRGWDQVGAHAANFNTQSIGLALIGDFTDSLPENKQLFKAKEMILCAKEKGYIPADYILMGHRDMGSTTSCPGQALYDRISIWPQKGDPIPPN